MSHPLASLLRMTPPSASSLALGVLWGKSKGPGLLIAHLLDSAAAAERLWDDFLPFPLRAELDGTFGGRGREYFAWLAGMHDIGKATPAFQGLVPDLAGRVRNAGLPIPPDLDYRKCPHNVAGDLLLSGLLREWGWPIEHAAWVRPMIGGHHGRFTTPRNVRGALGDQAWHSARADLIALLCEELDIDTSEPPGVCPSAAVQLALSGAIVMADWLASNDRAFPPIWDVEAVSMTAARVRAARALSALHIRGGPELGAGGAGEFEDRFGFSPRPVQRQAMELAARGVPGLMLIEAPTGEGKTEAGLAVTELFAAKRGCDGLFMAMPTQATSDPMFSRMLAWAEAYPGVAVGLLHGKRQLNPQWAALLEHVEFGGVDEYGIDGDGYGLAGPPAHRESHAPGDWFLGRQRGLLMPFVVGTVDQLLLAATATRYVMLRHLGLFGKVVVVDEVHAYDAYMSVFLHEGLRWLGGAGVPVVLMSATLPAEARSELLTSYAQGVTQLRDVELEYRCQAGQNSLGGYPRISTIGAAARAEDRVTVEVSACPHSGPDRQVAVRTLPDQLEDPWGVVAEELGGLLAGGGVALVVCNTVSRAQACYLRLKPAFGQDLVLLHGRLVAGERADRAQRLLDELGPPPSASRPNRRVVVATQVAEQSFDIDADLLVSDLAPVDLLVQRLGRVHRHARPAGSRPDRLSTAQLLVTGYWETSSLPDFPLGSQYVYHRRTLMAAALAVRDNPTWRLPGDVPALVGSAYWPARWPDAWRDAAQEARSEWEQSQQQRQGAAAKFLLRGADQLGRPHLAGLHDRGPHTTDEEAARAIVRDGKESLEVTLLLRDADGTVQTLTGAALGPDGDWVHSDERLLSEVVGSSVRLPPDETLTHAVLAQDPGPLPGWSGHPWLGHAKVLFLGERPTALAGYRITYDHELGLVKSRG